MAESESVNVVVIWNEPDSFREFHVTMKRYHRFGKLKKRIAERLNISPRNAKLKIGTRDLCDIETPYIINMSESETLVLQEEIDWESVKLTRGF